MVTDETSAQLDAAHEHLDRLGALEAEIETLRERETELEVETISARASRGRSEPGARPDLGGKEAGAIVEALDRVRALEDELTGHETSSAEETERLRAGRDALLEWLSPPKTSGECAPGRSSGRGRAALALLSLAALVAAFFVHWAFLVLLVPAGAASAFLWTGNDPDWQRAGARRRFESTGLAAPATWEREAVAARREDLEEALEAKSAHRAHAPVGDPETVAADLEEARQTLALAMVEAELEGPDLSHDLEAELRGLSGPYLAQRDLDRVKSQLKRRRREAESLRSEVFGFLSRAGALEGDGKADLKTLSSAIAALDQREREGG